MFRSTWGLSPALMHWVYISAVRPTLLYEALVWWQATKNSELMARTQLQALVCITGALRSTPTKALETILGIDPIDIHAQLTAGKAAQRLVASGNMTTQSFGHSLIGIKPNQQNGLHDPQILPGTCTQTAPGRKRELERLFYKRLLHSPGRSLCHKKGGNLVVNSQAAIRSKPSSTVSLKNVKASREALDSLSTTKSVRIY